MALPWTAAGLLEAQKTFRRLKAYRQPAILETALQEHMKKAKAKSAIETIKEAAQPHDPTMPASPFSTEIVTSPTANDITLNVELALSDSLYQALPPWR